MAYHHASNGGVSSGLSSHACGGGITDYSGDEHESRSGGNGGDERLEMDLQDKPTYLLEHLATFTVNKESGIVYPADGMRRLLQLEKTTGIWSQKMQLCLDYQWVLIMDYETGNIIERFPATLIQEPTAFTSNDAMELYNNILVFIVSGGNGGRSEMHIFQSQSVSAVHLVEDLKNLRNGKPVTHQHESVNNPTQNKRAISGSNLHARHVGEHHQQQSHHQQSHQQHHRSINMVDQYVADSGGFGTGATANAETDSEHGAAFDETSSIASDKYERDVTVLNHCFDDIEKFIARLQHAAAATRELERRRRNRKSKKKDPGEGLLTLRTRPPHEKEFIDIFAKFKLSFNLLAKLKAHIHDPNAPELVHFLFTPLALIVEAASDTYYEAQLPTRVVNPLLTREAINLLCNCVTSKETELWRSLGDAWTIPRDQWKDDVGSSYHPVFLDGWSPDYLVVDELETQHVSASGPGNMTKRRLDTATIHYYQQHQQQQQQQQPPNGRNINDERDDFPHHYNNTVTPAHTNSALVDFSAHSEISIDSIDRSGTLALGNEASPSAAVASPSAGVIQSITNGLQNLNTMRGGDAEEQILLEAWLDELQAAGAKIVIVTYPRTANNDKELSVARGEYLEIMDDTRKWWKARNIRGQIAHVPHTIVAPYNYNESEISSSQMYGQQQQHHNRTRIEKGDHRGQDTTTDWIRNKHLASSQTTVQSPQPALSAPADNMQEELKTVLRLRQAKTKTATTTATIYIHQMSSPAGVQRWLRAKNFSDEICQRLASYRGQDLFTLSAIRLEELFGPEGRRLCSQLKLQKSISGPGQNNSNNGGSTNSHGTSNNSNPCNNSSINNNISNTSSGNISGANSSNISSSNNNGAVGLVSSCGGTTSAAATAAKNQLEQLNTMREALFAQDGWGCQHVNQETNWEVPSSPEPTNKDSSGGPPIWKPNINNGTDLWESNLRNGGQPTTQAVQKTPWSHTPSSNLGGTWGEDDDGADSSSVWAGSSSNSTAGGATVGVGAGGVGTTSSGAGPNSGPQWAQGVGAGGTASGGSGAVNMNTGGGVSSNNVNVPGTPGAVATPGAGNGWGDPRDIRSGPLGGGPLDMRNVDPRDPMRAASAGDPRDLRMMDPRDPIRGDPRGISGRLNGNAELWGQHHPSMAHNPMQAMNKMVGQSGVGATGNVTPAVVQSGNVGGIGGPGNVTNLNVTGGVPGNNVVNSQWGSTQTVVGPKDIASMTGGNNKQVSGWEEPSPPPQRRNMPNYDDGTSLWGGQQSRVPGGGGVGASGSHWKDITDPMNRGHLMRNTIGNQGTPNSGVGLGGSSGVAGLVGTGGQTVVPGVVGPANPANPMTGVGIQSRLAGGGGNTGGVGPGISHKPENTMWVHGGSGGVAARNTNTWGDDNNHNVGGTNWVDDKSNVTGGIAQIGGNAAANLGANNAWNDSTAAWKNKMAANAVGGGGWNNAPSSGNEGADLNADWNAAHTGMILSNPQPKINVGGLNTEIIKQSKQYRMLVESGFKKDDVERALISANMNFDEAADMLRSTNMMDWGRHEDTLRSYTEHANPNSGGGGGNGIGNVFQGRYLTSTQPTISFPPNNLNNISNTGVGASGVNNPNLAALNSMQPLQVQKYLNQGGPHNIAGGGPQPVPAAAAVSFGQGATNVTAAAVNAAGNTNNQPSAQQLRMLVQQIQMAVHNGYLSNQILNQPLAPTTLILLNQLLSAIKHLQGTQQSLQRGNNANNLQLNLTITKYKQQIQNLQNQINTQQAMYVKQHQALQQQQQQQQQPNPQQQHPIVTTGAAAVAVHAVSGTNAAAEYLRPHDAMSALPGSFSEMNLKPTGYQGAPNQQSRLKQWKLPVLEKDLATDSPDFSRAPGATKQPGLSGGGGVNANNMGSLGLQSDGTWSTGRNIGDGWPDSSNDNENKDWSVAQNAATAATTYTDLVQEFEPGKPWKGSQIKSIEDDPTITPGSVARSPLSINPTPKDADMFANASKSSPTDLPPLGLTSSAWTFNPNTSNPNFSSWSDNNQQCASASEIWAATAMNKTRGPPPGLVGSNKVGVANTANLSANVVTGGSASNGWLGAAGARASASNASNVGWSGSGGGNNSNWSSNWLLLKNLTAQIDSSTLRTLCMQHGPLINFHLYLSQGIALCKYATREEANKAQVTLNNCVLGNSTICAESPSENEVQSILQHMPPGNNGGGGSNGSGSGNGSGNNAVMNNSSGAGGPTANSVGGNGAVINGAGGSSGNNSSTTALNGGGGGGGNNGQGSGNANNGNNNVSGGAVNANTSAATNSSNTNSNNAAAVNWRQTPNNQQQQPQQNQQARPPVAGRETDFDYISKYVCSIVDD